MGLRRAVRAAEEFVGVVDLAAGQMERLGSATQKVNLSGEARLVTAAGTSMQELGGTADVTHGRGGNVNRPSNFSGDQFGGTPTGGGGGGGGGGSASSSKSPAGGVRGPVLFFGPNGEPLYFYPDAGPGGPGPAKGIGGGGGGGGMGGGLGKSPGGMGGSGGVSGVPSGLSSHGQEVTRGDVEVAKRLDLVNANLAAMRVALENSQSTAVLRRAAR